VQKLSQGGVVIRLSGEVVVSEV